jgi:hypothetical protein
MTTDKQPGLELAPSTALMVLDTANLTVEMAVGSQLSATVNEGDL